LYPDNAGYWLRRVGGGGATQSLYYCGEVIRLKPDFAEVYDMRANIYFNMAAENGVSAEKKKGLLANALAGRAVFL
jgi:hypothetical protein